MLSKNFLASLVLAVAASATPTDFEKRGGGSCGSSQELKCCTSINKEFGLLGGVGLGCTNVLNIADCNQIAGCCRQSGKTNICVAV